MSESQREDALKKKLELEKNMKDESLALIDSFPDPVRRCIKRKIEFQCSGWLSVIPVEGNHFDMSPNEFRDRLALRYGRTPIDLPTHCDADGEVFSVNHALNCSKGGLVYGRHNELRDLNCSLLELAGLKQVISEPIILETNDKQLRADWGARGFWEPQKQALLIAVLSMLKVLLCNIPLSRQSLTQEKIKSYRLTLKLQKQDERHLPQFLPLAMQFLIRRPNITSKEWQFISRRNEIWLLSNHWLHTSKDANLYSTFSSSLLERFTD